MKKELPDKKDNFFVHYYKSTKYSIEGFFTAIKEERSLKLYLVCAILVLFLSYFYQIQKEEWILVWGMLFLILAIELLNTALENVVDLVTKEKNPYAKKAKDCGSAATFAVVILGCILFCMIFFPYFFS